jgi:hypothetical protein
MQGCGRGAKQGAERPREESCAPGRRAGAQKRPRALLGFESSETGGDCIGTTWAVTANQKPEFGNLGPMTMSNLT